MFCFCQIHLQSSWAKVSISYFYSSCRCLIVFLTRFTIFLSLQVSSPQISRQQHWPTCSATSGATRESREDFQSRRAISYLNQSNRDVLDLICMWEISLLLCVTIIAVCFPLIHWPLHELWSPIPREIAVIKCAFPSSLTVRLSRPFALARLTRWCWYPQW